MYQDVKGVANNINRHKIQTNPKRKSVNKYNSLHTVIYKFAAFIDFKVYDL